MLTEEKDTLNRDTYREAHKKATQGGTRNATSEAEEKIKQGQGIDPMVDPKGLPHLGPIRRSLPRFVKKGNLWLLTNGLPMAEETLMDTTGSIGRENINTAFKVLIESYEMMTSGNNPIFQRYDTQIATATFNDVQDKIYDGIPTLFRTQFEMAEKIAIQMALCAPGCEGKGNGKEDPQFGLFGAAYLTAAAINNWGLKWYHYAISDEPLVEHIDFKWLKDIFGDDVLERVKENGYDFDVKNLPDTVQVIRDLQKKAHAFFFQVSDRRDVTAQWTDLYGADHVIMLPNGTEDIHFVKAVVAGLTEGVLDLETANDFLCEHGATANKARSIVRAVAHIPLGAQTFCPNFDKIPMAGDLFREKTDLWPIDKTDIKKSVGKKTKTSGPGWL